MKIKLRDYQKEALEGLRAKYDAGTNRFLCRSFVGSGKTTGIAAQIPHFFPELSEPVGHTGGVLFLSHRREILFHAYKTFKALHPDRWIGIDMGELGCTGYEDFVFGSVDSLGRMMSERIDNYEKRTFGVIIVDEGHHLTEYGTWDNVLTYFGVGSDPSTRFDLPNGKKPLFVMLTATPDRSDGVSLAPFYDEIGFDYSILFGIENGWLTDIRGYQYVSPDIDDEEAACKHIAKIWREQCGLRKTLVFRRSVADSQKLADSLIAAGYPNVGHVDGTTDKKDRDRLLDGFYATGEGAIDLVTNHAVLTEGYDNPNIHCIIDDRPCSSRSLFEQKIGRGLRPHPSAQVDLYETAEERKAAIAASPKPELLYIATFMPLGHELGLAAVAGLDSQVDVEGQRLVSEVVDLIKLIETEQPDRPIDDVKSVSDLKARYKRIDFWTQTVYNESLVTTTPNRWVVEGQGASLFLPTNPHPTRVEEKVPVIWHIKRIAKGRYKGYEIGVGGWNHALQRPCAAWVRVTGETTTGIEAITSADRYLDEHHPKIAGKVRRGGLGPADESIKKYLKNAGVPFSDGITQELASILQDRYRINDKLTKVVLPK